MDKLIVTAAITGAELTKSDNPNLPITPDEQAQAAKACVEAGASVIHIHVRDDLGKPSQSVEHFKRTVQAIEGACAEKPIIQFSTGGAVGEPIANRIAPLALKPEMASFNTGTINFGDDIFVNSFPDMREMAKAFKSHGVVPEYECYEVGHVANIKILIKEGLIEPPYHVQFVLGVKGAMPGETLEDLKPLIRQLPENATWGVAGIGRFQLPLSKVGIEAGGNVRVGLEDNIYYEKGVLAKSNAQLVERVVQLAKDFGRPIATIAEARQMLGL